MQGIVKTFEGTVLEKNKKISAFLLQHFKVVQGQVLPSHDDMWKYYLVNRLQDSPNMEPAVPPMHTQGGMMETVPGSLPLAVEKSFMYADRQVLPKYYEDIDWDQLFSPKEDVDEYHQEIRKRSAWWSTFGTKKGSSFQSSSSAECLWTKAHRCCIRLL